jgi:hypothetical protein
MLDARRVKGKKQYSENMTEDNLENDSN